MALTLEQLKAEKARRDAAKSGVNEEGLLYKIPGIGGAIKSADQYLADKLGASPQPAIDQMGDLGKIAVDSATLGGASYVGDAVTGSNRFSEETRQARDRQGWAGTAADLAGGVMTPGFVPKTAGRVGRVLWNAGGGGAQSVIDAYTHGERDIGDLALSALAGSGISGAASAIADPIASWWSRRTERAKALDKLPYKTKDDLVQARDAQYKEVADSDALYQGLDLKRLGGDMNQIDMTGNFYKGASDYRKKVVKDLNKGDLSPKKLNEVRKDIRQAEEGNKRYQNVDKLKDMTGVLDKFTDTAPLFTKDPLGNYVNTSPHIKNVLKEADVKHGRVKRFELVDNATKEALRKTTRGRFNPFAPSPESATIQSFSDLARDIDKGKIRSKFTEPEIAQIKQLEEGTPMRNTGGRAEPYSFSGKFGGLGAQLAAALQFIPAVGQAASGLAVAGMSGAELLTRMGNRATRRDLEDLKTMILDPAGKGLKGVTADPKVVDALKNRAAKAAGAAERTVQREVNPTKTFTVNDPGTDLDGQEGTVIRETKNGYVLKMSDGTTRAVGKRLVR